jgi:hypothetical protein
MEGVFFESSLTTPFHFLLQSEMSRSPSQPVRWLRYDTFALERGVAHSALFDIDYYLSHTEAMTNEANRLNLEPLVEEEAYSIFRLPESDPIEVARYEPTIYAGDEEFVDMAVEWWDDLDNLDRWVVADGPEDWERFDELDGPYDLGPELDTDGEAVSDVVIDNHQISFTTTAVGVPHLVKTSYFPNWEATGAEGPYLATPSMMVVVPTQPEVSLEFSRTWAENLGMVFTVLALGFIGWWLYKKRATHRPAPADAEA